MTSHHGHGDAESTRANGKPPAGFQANGRKWVAPGPETRQSASRPRGHPVRRVLAVVATALVLLGGLVWRLARQPDEPSSSCSDTILELEKQRDSWSYRFRRTHNRCK
jgi:hypothetical protein